MLHVAVCIVGLQLGALCSQRKMRDSETGRHLCCDQGWRMEWNGCKIWNPVLLLVLAMHERALKPGRRRIKFKSPSSLDLKCHLEIFDVFVAHFLHSCLVIKTPKFSSNEVKQMSIWLLFESPVLSIFFFSIIVAPTPPTRHPSSLTLT